MIELTKHIGEGFANGKLYDVLVQLQNLSVLTEGNVYYVAKSGNNTTGKSWETAFNTIAAAITAANATITWAGNEEDNVILIAPGTYAESLTTIPYYCHMIGLGVRTLANSGMSVRIEPASGVAMSGTALGLHLYNLAFVALGAVDILDFGTCNDVLIEGCMLAPGDGDVVNGISTTNSDGLNIRNCKFKSGLGGGAGMTTAMSFAGGADKYLHNAVIENNIIAGLDATGTGIYVASDCTGTESIIRGNTIYLSGAGIGIDENSDDVIVESNKIYTQAGTWADCNTDLAIDNLHNNGTTVTAEPNVPG